MSDKLSFITPNLLKCDYNDILKLIEKNKKLEPYRFDLEKTFAYQKYTLSEKEENVIAKLTTTNPSTTGGSITITYLGASY